MRKYSANYTHTSPNFVIQNVREELEATQLLPILYVIKNIILRGVPTRLSKYLQSELGAIHSLDQFKEPFLLVSNQPQTWHNTIKGNAQGNDFPARTFFDKIIPKEFGEYAFVRELMIPEIEINEIVGVENKAFMHQQVDFYLPQAKLVIEIDGQQHKLDERTRKSDLERNQYLSDHGIRTIRIDTPSLKTGSYKIQIQYILEHLERFETELAPYKKTIQKLNGGDISDLEIQTKLLPTAIIRFQILLLDLLIYKKITLEQKWQFHILADEYLDGFAELAIQDLLIWIDQLWRLKYKKPLSKPDFSVYMVKESKFFKPKPYGVNIDFSIFKRYTDEHLLNKDVVYVRTDYFDQLKDRNYFTVNTTKPINYQISDQDKPALLYFLENLFDKPTFKGGQYAIIANALNKRDTIGLLPTGGGKSLCYQLPSMLQPAINFVVCPIKSLMYDQRENLTKMMITQVQAITSDQSDRRAFESRFENGGYLMVWVSPEKFQIQSFRDKISAIFSRFSIAYAVIDEVHCLSEWGHDFRTSYLNLAQTIDRLSTKANAGVQFIGLTATASVNVLKDIKIEFSRQRKPLANDDIKSLLDYTRKELHFQVINDGGEKSQVLKSVLAQLNQKEGFLTNNVKSGLIFTPNVNGKDGCFQIANELNVIYPKQVHWYAGEVPKMEVRDAAGVKIETRPVLGREAFNKYKFQVQKKYKQSQYPLLVATKAFGMGIDKDNIDYTFHYGLPASIESLYQEAGRAGRWNLEQEVNQRRKAKCFILYSPETYDKVKVNRLFEKDTSFSEMKLIVEDAKWEGQDVFKQVFLMTRSQRSLDDDYRLILHILDRYFAGNSKVKIYWEEVLRDLSVKSDVLQRAIYRLSLLGIVKDWTTNFVDHFEVHFDTRAEAHVIQSVASYISKYDPELDIEREIRRGSKATLIQNAVWFLLNWIFENIAYSRKQSLKTLADWCSEFTTSEQLKQRLDSYFIFTEDTFVLQHIAENPKEIEKWFEQLVEGKFRKSDAQMIELKDSLSRYLESYRDHAGLNFISGFVRLVLNEYTDGDGHARLESALQKVKTEYTVEEKNFFLNRLLVLGKLLNQEQQEMLCSSIAKVMPGLLMHFAQYYNLDHILNDIYAQKLLELKKLNKQLYEQFAEI